MKPAFFESAVAFRAWLDEHHATAAELTIGFWNARSGRSGMSYVEAVEEALAYGWIDGVRHRIDEHAYSNRFTPRKPRSNWSRVNVERVNALKAAGRMHPAGLAAFDARGAASGYSYEERPKLSPEYLVRLSASPAAREFFDAQPPSYRRIASWWVMSAKREDTRLRRLTALIEASVAGHRLDAFRPRERPPSP